MATWDCRVHNSCSRRAVHRSIERQFAERARLLRTARTRHYMVEAELLGYGNGWWDITADVVRLRMGAR